MFTVLPRISVVVPIPVIPIISIISMFTVLPRISVVVPIPVIPIIPSVVTSIISTIIPTIISSIITSITIISPVPTSPIMSHVLCWLPHFILLLSLLIVDEVVEDTSGVLVAVQDLQHLLPFLGGNPLRVPTVSNWLVLIVLQPDVPQLGVRHVLHVDPLHFELALPLVLCPYTS